MLISGEFHYARCPEAEWHDELLKIKAGGVSVVATYIFWIHHEEVQGVWDWTGQRDLRKFLQLATRSVSTCCCGSGRGVMAKCATAVSPTGCKKWAMTKCLTCAGTIRVISVT